MTTIFTHLDGDGVCSAALIKMIPKYRDSYVYFTHPAGLKHDLSSISGDDIIICDIAIDLRRQQSIYALLEQFSNEFSVIYIDHHAQPDGMPNNVVNIHDQNVSATELVYRFFYEQFGKYNELRLRSYPLDSGFIIFLLDELKTQFLFDENYNMSQYFDLAEEPLSISNVGILYRFNFTKPYFPWKK